MSAQAFALNTEAAREGDSGGSNRITESGEYIGLFTKVKHIDAKTGAKGIQFSFKSTDEKEADYLTLYTHNKLGQEIYGYKQLMALMTCAGVKNINPTETTIMEYDFDLRKDVEVNATLYPELMNVSIGLVLQKVLYTKNNQERSDGERMQFYGFFEAATRKTAKERLDQSEAKSLDNMLKTLSTKDEREKQAAGYDTQQVPPNHGNNADFDDEIPF